MENTQNLDNYKQTIYGKIAFGILVLFLLLGVHPYQFYQDVPGHGLIRVTNNLTWIAVSLFILFASQHVIKQRIFIVNRGINILLLTLIPLIIPFYYGNAEQLIVGILRVLGVALGIITAMLIIQLQFSKKTWMLIICCILTSVIAESIFGIFQHYIAEPTELTKLRGGTINVPFGSFYQPNIMGTFITTGIACGLLLIVLMEYPQEAKKNKTLIRIYRYLIVATCFLGGWVAVILLSRTTHLAMGLIIATSFFSLFASVITRKQLSNYLTPLLIGILIASIDITMATELFRPSDNIFESSGGRRIQIWSVSLALLLENLAIGVGYGDFFANYSHQNAYHYANDLPYFFGQMTHPHNEFLLWGVEGGILPLAGLLIGIICFLFYGLKTSKKNYIYFIPLLPLGLHTQLELPFYSYACMWIMFCVLLAFTCQQCFQYKNQNISNIMLKTTSFFTTIITCIFTIGLLLNLQAHYHFAKYTIDYKREHLSKIYFNGSFENRIITSLHVENAQFALLTMKNEEMLNKYVIWASYNQKIAPIELVYKLHYQALLALGRKEEADEIYKKGKFLFPEGEEFN